MIPVIFVEAQTCQPITPIADGDITALITAVNTANNETASPGCDTITLAQNGTYILTTAAVDNDQGASGLPNITSEIVIEGNNATITRSDAANTPDFRIINVSGGNLTLENATISNGSLNPANVTPGDGSPKDNGAGIVVYNAGTLILRNVIVENNTTPDAGGGVHNSIDTMLTIEDSTIRGNTAGKTGGGLITAPGTQTQITNTIFEGNTSEDGGNVFHLGGSLQINGGAVSQGMATRDGGGLYNLGSEITIIGTEFGSNSADDRGGGVFNNGTLFVSEAYIHDNETVANGGGIDNTTGATLFVTRSSIVSNTAGNAGGGIGNDGTLTLSNSTVSGNSATNNIGLQIFHGPNAPRLQIEFSTLVSENNVIHIDNNTVTAKANVLSSAGTVCTGNAPTSAGYNVVTDSSCALNTGTDVTTANPGIYTLSFTKPPVHVLQVGSPALNRIPQNDCTYDADANPQTPAEALLNDQIGNARPLQNLCDVGAYEGFLSGSSYDVNNDGYVTPADAMYVINRVDTQDLTADVNNSNSVTIDDVNLVLQAIGTPN